MITFVPILFVLLLIGAGSLTSSSTKTLLQQAVSQPDVSWAGGCVVDGVPSDPSKCHKEEKPPSPSLLFDASDKVRDIPVSELQTINGIKVPIGWPVFKKWQAAADGMPPCNCLTCQDHARLDADAVCGPLFTPGPSQMYNKTYTKRPMSCAAEDEEDEQEEGRAEKNSTKGRDDVKGEKENAKKQRRMTDLGHPNGLGEGGMALSPSSWSFETLTLAGIMHYTAVALNTYKLDGSHHPRRGCYGVQAPPAIGLFDRRLDGWCNCSSGVFIPAAFDYVRSSLGHVTVFESATIEGISFDHDFGNWVTREEQNILEKFSIYGDDETFGIQFAILSGAWESVNGFTKTVNHLLKVVYAETLLLSVRLVLFHFDIVLDWFKTQFFAAQNFVNALCGWLKDSNAKDFNEMRNSVLLGRSMASFSLGLATMVTAAKVSQRNILIAVTTEED